MEKITSTIEFGQKYADAFAALPEPYQADDVLEFYIDESEIRCQPKDSELAVLGNWTGMYNETKEVWFTRFGLRRF